MKIIIIIVVGGSLGGCLGYFLAHLFFKKREL